MASKAQKTQTAPSTELSTRTIDSSRVAAISEAAIPFELVATEFISYRYFDRPTALSLGALFITGVREETGDKGPQIAFLVVSEGGQEGIIALPRNAVRVRMMETFLRRANASETAISIGPVRFRAAKMSSGDWEGEIYYDFCGASEPFGSDERTAAQVAAIEEAKAKARSL